MRMSASAAASSSTRDRLVMEHVGLVKALAQRLAQRLPSQVEVSELVSVGVLGLIDAAGRYQPSLGVPFDAFARRRVQGAMLDSLRGLDWAPRSLRSCAARSTATIAAAAPRLGREPEAARSPTRWTSRETEYDEDARPAARRRPGADPPRRTPADDAGRCSRSRVDPDDGPHAQLERKELREHLARAHRRSCPNASGRFWRSTTSRS